jgi:hypothetical protein
MVLGIFWEYTKLVYINMFIHINIFMRTTLDLSDELLTEIKIMAALERTTLKDLISELLRSGIRAKQSPSRPASLSPAYRSNFRVGRDWLSSIRRRVDS